MPPKLEYHIHNGEGVYTALQETLGIPAGMLSELGGKAVEAKRLAYCPYSSFRVGCAVLTADGTIITGANVENASYPVGACAETTTVGKMVTEGHTKLKAVAVATDVSPPASPCGKCRQFIREFASLDTPIFMYDSQGSFIVKTLEELLPMSFGPEDLPKRS